MTISPLPSSTELKSRNARSSLGWKIMGRARNVHVQRLKPKTSCATSPCSMLSLPSARRGRLHGRVEGRHDLTCSFSAGLPRRAPD
jgi:hypothetical protein